MSTAKPLFMMSRRDLSSGRATILYGHATANVMTDYWEAYADPGYVLEIQQLKGSMMNALRHPADQPNPLEPVIARYLGALQRGIVTAEAALSNLIAEFDQYKQTR